ncbi:hypothetical protein T439DRAFT_328465 [Meredithblackwellia eburnea MCA 4105]
MAPVTVSTSSASEAANFEHDPDYSKSANTFCTVSQKPSEVANFEHDPDYSKSANTFSQFALVQLVEITLLSR